MWKVDNYTPYTRHIAKVIELKLEDKRGVEMLWTFIWRKFPGRIFSCIFRPRVRTK